ncbi:hypothetical protein PINS_up010116 [Pythium insidiosum]|nr:hypothetical protein PINS_up010116 [Pythium insidiosum]
MCGEFYPVCVYGVQEPDGSWHVVDQECLDMHELSQYCREVIRPHPSDIIYRVAVDFEDALKCGVSAEDKATVQAFIDNFNGRFGDPKLFLAMAGSYEMEDLAPYSCIECGGTGGTDDESDEEDGEDA